MTSDLAVKLEEDGYILVPHYISDLAMEGLEKELYDLGTFAYGSEGFYGNLLNASKLTREIADRLTSAFSMHAATHMLRPVKAFILDKSTAFNWNIPWHQDLKIAVKGRADHSGFSGWTVESGIHHVEPPLMILANMLTARIHIDDSDGNNGGMLLVPGSHRMGILADPEKQVSDQNILCPQIVRGGILLFRPLMIHASPEATVPKTRRVLQIEFAPYELLPPGLEWHC